MPSVWRHMRSLLHKDGTKANWRSMLADPSSAALLRQEDKNVAQLQNMLQELSASGRETFSSVITSLTMKVCVAENDEILLSYARTILEVFVLYSIATSDSAWMCDSRSAYIGRQIELMSEVTYSLNQALLPPDPHLGKNCLQVATLLELRSRRERCRAEIIRNTINLADTIPLNSPFTTYDHGSQLHQLNSFTFLRKIRPTGHYWISMAYCLATEQVVEDAPPSYTIRASGDQSVMMGGCEEDNAA
ncbi:hypothetical protein OEA41_008703 [Lepraria neglecta]|uniref:Uncharacterized protein n=1 Tax=Lepraria neglecta TaxID=209136 RepID=A0AAD9Z170_9LECA|nr:hypothetical protein OEA41_008703 [Lepraria neglecta]